MKSFIQATKPLETISRISNSFWWAEGWAEAWAGRVDQFPLRRRSS
jgi:hypothetical protein